MNEFISGEDLGKTRMRTKPICAARIKPFSEGPSAMGVLLEVPIVWSLVANHYSIEIFRPKLMLKERLSKLVQSRTLLLPGQLIQGHRWPLAAWFFRLRAASSSPESAALN
jgi:hypothetical protein